MAEGSTTTGSKINFTEGESSLLLLAIMQNLKSEIQVCFIVACFCTKKLTLHSSTLMPSPLSSATRTGPSSRPGGTKSRTRSSRPRRHPRAVESRSARRQQSPLRRKAKAVKMELAALMTTSWLLRPRLRPSVAARLRLRRPWRRSQTSRRRRWRMPSRPPRRRIRVLAM